MRYSYLCDYANFIEIASTKIAKKQACVLPCASGWERTAYTWSLASCTVPYCRVVNDSDGAVIVHSTHIVGEKYGVTAASRTIDESFMPFFQRQLSLQQMTSGFFNIQ